MPVKPTARRPKRRNQEGTIYQIEQGPRAGEWRAQLSLPDGSRHGVSGRSQEEVERKMYDARTGAPGTQTGAPPVGLLAILQRIMAAEQEMSQARLEVAHLIKQGFE